MWLYLSATCSGKLFHPLDKTTLYTCLLWKFLVVYKMSHIIHVLSCLQNVEYSNECVVYKHFGMYWRNMHTLSFQ